MEKSNMKNMLVLKNLPSNIVDEAIIILKENKKIKKFEKIYDMNNQNEVDHKELHEIRKKNSDQDYIIKEAEMVISKYISNLEQRQSNEKNEKMFQRKFKALKKYSIFITIMFIVISIASMTIL